MNMCRLYINIDHAENLNKPRKKRGKQAEHETKESQHRIEYVRLFQKTETYARRYENKIITKEASNKQGDICIVHRCQCVDTKHKPKTKQVPKHTTHK